MKQVLKAIVPASQRPIVRRLYSRVRCLGLTRRCPVCLSFLRRFIPHGIPAQEEALCPVCRSKAPHRLAEVFFARHQSLFRAGGLMVHVAPEPELRRRLRKRTAIEGMQYRSGAINGGGDQFLDILALPISVNSVDLFYCCHVLNALQDDRSAMREVLRVLHPQGTAVLQVPAYHCGASTLETHSRAERLRVFQDDGIYRCYTPQDYVDRLQETGFIVETFRASLLPASIVRRYALKDEVLHVCRKPG